MQDLVYEIIIVEFTPNCNVQYEYIKLDIMVNALKKFFIDDLLQISDDFDWLLYNS